MRLRIVTIHRGALWRAALGTVVAICVWGAACSVAGSALARRSRPTVGEAGCGGVVSAGPAGWHHAYRAPLAIGDSTMLLALPALSREGFAGNAHGCRQYPEALGLLSELRRAGQLPRLVVIALGANGEVSDGEIDRALRILGHDRLLVLVTPRELGGGSGSDAQLVRVEGRRHPQRIRVLDWVAYSAGHPGWFEPDGLHPSPGGAAALARLIGRVHPLAAPPRSVPVPSCGAARPGSGVGAATPLGGVSLLGSGRSLAIAPRSSRLQLTLINANPFPLTGAVLLEALAPAGQTIAARCVSATPSGRSVISLRLTPAVIAELELGRRYPLRVELSLTAPPDLTARITARYLLRRRQP